MLVAVSVVLAAVYSGFRYYLFTETARVASSS